MRTWDVEIDIEEANPKAHHPRHDRPTLFISLSFPLSAVSFSCLSNSRTVAQLCRCRVSGATGANDYAPTPHEWNKNWQSNYKKTEYTTRHKSRSQLPQPTSTSCWSTDH